MTDKLSGEETLMAEVALPPIGHLDAYIAAVHKLPILTPEQEITFATRLRNSNDLQAARSLIVSHLRAVVSISRQYLGYGLPHADLIQEGNIGLMKAVKRFDPERGVRLISFALYWIKAEIHEYILKNWRILKIASTKAQRKLFFKLRSHKKQMGSLTTEQVRDISNSMSVPEKDVLEMEGRLASQDLSLDPAEQADGEEHPINWLAAPSAEPTQVLEAQAYLRLQTEGLSIALAALDERSRTIIESRWLRDETQGGGKTLSQLAQLFGLSAERVRQIETKALRTMRSLLAAHADGAQLSGVLASE